MVALINPPGSDRTLAAGSTPVLAPSRPLIVVNSNFFLPERPVVTIGTDANGFLLHNCSVSLRSISVHDTKCGGNLCDQQSIVLDGGVVRERCGCVQMKHRLGVVIVRLELEVSLPDGTSFTGNLTSKWWNSRFLFSAPLPPGTRAANLEDLAVEERIYTAANNVLAQINNSGGGFMVLGWTKRGEVLDHAVDQLATVCRTMLRG